MGVEIVVDQVESGETTSGTRYTYTLAEPGKAEIDNPYEPSAGEFELLTVSTDGEGRQRPAIIPWTPEDE